MKPPIIVSDPGDIFIFESVEAAERYIEPWGLEQLSAYDSEGRLLSLTPGDYVAHIDLAEKEPSHANELRNVLVCYLWEVGPRVGISRDWLLEASLEQIVSVTLEKCKIK